MFKYYKLDIIPLILNRFKVNNIVITGISNKNIMDQILKYSQKSGSSYITIDSNSDVDVDYNGFALNILPNLSNYDAIFLDDDPNWYTIYNELKIIKKNNDEFPLVFICNNIFPHKRRDSYINPDVIPDDFLNDYSPDLEIEGIQINDGFYHSCEEKTDKNGVLTAIEDFLKENKSIGLFNIKLSNGITIAYSKNSLNQIRMGRLSEEISGYELEFDGLNDHIVENQILINHISKYNFSNNVSQSNSDFKYELEKIIDDYEVKFRVQDEELNLKNSQIESFDSRLNLKNSQITNIESKLVNREHDITVLTDELQKANNQINSLKIAILSKEQKETELNHQLKSANDVIKDNDIRLNEKDQDINIKKNQIKNMERELVNNQTKFNSLKKQYDSQLSKLDTKEYCIDCYKDEISNNHVEINYLKNQTFIKKLLSPLGYVYLFFKSKPKDWALNFKLYKALKNSKCFDIGFYLNNNEDLMDSKWCKYFSPELHYVCNGFKEDRKFNKKYFNRNSKKDLLDYILNCNY